MKKAITISLIIAAISLLIYFSTGFLKKILSPAPSYNQSTSVYKKEDIDKNEKVDEADQEFVNKQLNCKKGDLCWNKVVGKTINGDNPIYAFDLDLNNDGVIDQLDAAQIQNAK